MSATLLRPWTRAQYHRAAEAGAFAPEEKLELLQGMIYRKMPQDRKHALAIRRAAECLEAWTQQTPFHVQQQQPIALTTDGEPEPDIAVIRGQPTDYPSDHPTEEDVVLVVEVSNATLAFDRKTKAVAYAAAGVAEYWIIDLVHQALEVRRQPQAGGYAQCQVLPPDGTLAPLFASDRPFLVRALLP